MKVLMEIYATLESHYEHSMECNSLAESICRFSQLLADFRQRLSCLEDLREVTSGYMMFT